MMSNEEEKKRLAEAIRALSGERRTAIAERIESGEFDFGAFSDFYPDAYPGEGHEEKRIAWGADAMHFDAMLGYIASELRDFEPICSPEYIIECLDSACRTEATWGDAPTSERLAEALLADPASDLT
jgi:hypothetical protein